MSYLFEIRRTALLVATAVSILSAGVPAQAVDSDLNQPGMQSASAALAEHQLQLLGNSIRADKKMLVAGNMKLSDTEATGFWPLYDAYQQELGALNKRSLTIIQAYAEKYKAATLDDETAVQLVRKEIAVDEDALKLRKAYIPKFLKVLPGSKVARYMQIENKIRAVVDYELADAIPLVP